MKKYRSFVSELYPDIILKMDIDNNNNHDRTTTTAMIVDDDEQTRNAMNESNDLSLLKRFMTTEINDNDTNNARTNEKPFNVVVDDDEEHHQRTMKLLSQGAEAKVFMTEFLKRKCVIKQRFRKRYRHPLLDQKLTKSRLTAEVRSLLKARQLGVRAPLVLYVDKQSASIFLEQIDGKSLKEVLKRVAKDNRTNSDDGSCQARVKKFGREIGELVARLHDGGVAHGDLTTSNFIVEHNTDQIYVIDFGLAKTQIIEEDIGVDLYVLERSLIAAHKEEGSHMWKEVLQTWREKCKKADLGGYKRYLEVRERGRKRSMLG